MAEISQSGNVVTLINVFTVRPEDQQPLLDLLVEATESVMNRRPGFVSANLHKSFDGTRVVNYAQWRSKEAFEAMLEDPAAVGHMRQAAGLAESFEPHLYEVAYVDEA
ncbi:antibiotic biosynthesis monooxygenase [Rubrobacter tropicus]|uniref:Antibiotic biosynthesis monooxygenase n=1 Tax=Rubrobacter tropicus TaxID=2653851 RepID=A0A6G8Q5L4_9ACTN|nr:antibiotic biosynthesis monooxygenase family protein [Rubrobacter tropicus]QIN81762.1 antibiotic biosynthesis monooxygenase [Rubrobacter tropicus]